MSRFKCVMFYAFFGPLAIPALRSSYWAGPVKVVAVAMSLVSPLAAVGAVVVAFETAPTFPAWLWILLGLSLLSHPTAVLLLITSGRREPKMLKG